LPTEWQGGEIGNEDGEDRYVVSFSRTQSHAEPNDRQRQGAQAHRSPTRRFDGAYLRFADDIEVSHHHGGELVETHADEAIWELMYFGHAEKSHTGGRS